MFWTNIITNPTPNSTAERIKKKKVKDTRFTLFSKIPIVRTSVYNVIQSNSAVRSKCKDVFTLTTIVKKSNINKITIKFNSPVNTIYKFIYSFYLIKMYPLYKNS